MDQHQAIGQSNAATNTITVQLRKRRYQNSGDDAGDKARGLSGAPDFN
jgi:hypothetical protein